MEEVYMNIRSPSLVLSATPMVTMLLLIVIGFTFYNISIEVLMLASAIITSGIALYLGHTWKEIQDSIVDKLKTTLPALFILIVVGGIIGSWMIGGTIPLLVYYGLKVISPEYLLVTTFVVCCIVSMCTGTSWGLCRHNRCSFDGSSNWNECKSSSGSWCSSFRCLFW